MELSFPRIFCVTLIYCVHTTTPMGTYMTALRNYHKSNQSFEVKAPHLPVSVTSLLRSSELEFLDEKYSLCNGIDIREITVLDVQKLFATNALTSVALTNCYLQRIFHTNSILKAVIEVNPDAIGDAYLADAERIYGNEPKGLMHGIPVLIKDNIDTLDKTETTSGSPALEGIRPNRDADVIKKLKKAGAIIIGKSNLSEFAYFRGLNPPNGWSGRGGQTLNPYNLHEDPSGSSSGSAVAVAANLVTVAVGTETDGSLISPASVEGICSIKPTLGLISTKGVIPISHSQDCLGPMARNIMDLTILFDAMVSDEVRDRRACSGSYIQCLLEGKRNPKPFRIGVIRFPFWDLSIINSTYLEAEIPQLNTLIKTLDESPIIHVIDPVDLPIGMLESISGIKEFTVLLHDFKHDINEYLKKDIISPFATPPYGNQLMPPKRIASLKDIIQYNIDHPSPEGYDQNVLILAEATDGLHNATYVKSLQTNRDFSRKYLDTLFYKYNLDAIVAPCESRISTSVESYNDVPIFADSVAAIAGYPSLVVPAGIGLKGVPFGINFIGKPYTEGRLLQLAHAVEEITLKREPPQFIVSYS